MSIHLNHDALLSMLAYEQENMETEALNGKGARVEYHGVL